MLAGGFDGLGEARADVLVAGEDLAVVFVLEVEPFHLFRGRVGGAADALVEADRGAGGEDGNGVDGSASQESAAAIGREEVPGFAIENVELEQVVRELVVRNGVARVEPFAVQDVAPAERFAEPGRVAIRPTLEEIELALAGAAREDVSAALQEQIAHGAEADAAVGAVEFFFDDDGESVKRLARDRRQILIAGLEPGASDVRRARIFDDRDHCWARITTMRWFRTCSMVVRAPSASVAMLTSWSGVKRWMCSGLSSGTDGTLATTKRLATRRAE